MDDEVARAVDEALFFAARFRGWGFAVGRLWLEVSYSPMRCWFDFHRAGRSFTLDLGPLGLQAGVADA
jgi:hypothetical protein